MCEGLRQHDKGGVQQHRRRTALSSQASVSTAPGGCLVATPPVQGAACFPGQLGAPGAHHLAPVKYVRCSDDVVSNSLCTRVSGLALRRAAACLLLVLACAHWPQSAAASARHAGAASQRSLVLTSGGAAADPAARPARHGGRAGRARGRRLRPSADSDAVGSAALPAARHHIYRPGVTADSCDASSFPAGVG